MTIVPPYPYLHLHIAQNGREGRPRLSGSGACRPHSESAAPLGFRAGSGCLQGAVLPPGRGCKVRARPSSRRGEAAAPARGSACARWAAGAPCRGSPVRAAACRSGRPPAGPGGTQPRVIFFLCLQAAGLLLFWALGCVAAGRARGAPRLAEILLSTQCSGHLMDTGSPESMNMEEER